MNKTFLFIALYSALFFAIFSFTLTIIASIYIASDLGGSTDIAIYTVSFYGIGNAVGIPLAGTFRQTSPVKKIHRCLLLFALLSLLCGLARGFYPLLALRFLQGVAVGPIYIFANQLLSGLIPKGKKPLFTTISLTMFSTVPILGACWGGWIAYDYHWRTPFFINAMILLLIAEYLRIRLKNYEPAIKSREFDRIGYLFYAVAVVSISFFLITGQQLDWFRSNGLIVVLTVGIISLLFFILWSLYHPSPLFNRDLFKDPVFIYGLFNLMFLFATYFGIVVLLAFWLNLYVNYTPIWVATLLGIMAVAGSIQAYLIGRWLGRGDARIPLALSLIVLAISCFYTTIFNEYIDFDRIAFSRLFAGFGLIFFLPPLFKLCCHLYLEERSVAAVSIFQIVRVISSSLGVILYITLWWRRRTFYHDRLGSTLTPFSEQTRAFFREAQNINLTGTAADAQLNLILERRATALALDDCFFLMGWILVGLLVLLASTLFWPGIRRHRWFLRKG